MPRRALFLAVVVAVLLLLHGVPWVVVVAAPGWGTAATVIGTALLAAAVVGLPVAMWQGHGARHRDRFAVAGDTWLGVIWILFSWSVVGAVISAALGLAGVSGPDRQRWVGAAVLIVTLVLCGYGLWSARRIPRVRALDVVLPRLGRGLDGLRVVMIADTHFGPIDRRRWSIRVARVVNELAADLLVHAGDVADGRVAQRLAQAAPLGEMTARHGKVFVTGNHEYMSGAAEWSAHLEVLGWTVLRNAHVILEKSASRLAVAGIDDRTAFGSGVVGHGADLERALAGVEPDVPVLLVSHQPRQVTLAVAAGVDLQLSGHTHGGQIWPFHLLVRAEQGILHGLSRHGERTQLYTTRGTGFWGPPFRVFAPSEITVLTLRSTAE